MIVRPARVIAIARRDLRAGLIGRRGAFLFGVAGVLLLPAAAVPLPSRTAVYQPPEIYVGGAAPPAVLSTEGVHRAAGGRATLAFHDAPDGTLIVRGMAVPDRVRAALDGDAATVRVERREPHFPTPGRSALFALISASILTGGVSESLGGERSRKTLQALLAAAVTRQEIVAGKWLAWGGFGATAALVTALISIVLGRVSAGWWLLPLPTVALGTVALALTLVRHTTDVVSGAAVSLRVLPALLSVTALIAWYFADTHPLVAAALPVGGALLAAGSTWPGPAPALVSTASTLLFSAALLWRTAADLELPPRPRPSWIQTARALALATAMAAVVWWTPLCAPLLWAAAGNARLTDALPHAPGALAAGLGLVVMAGLRAGRAPDAAQAVAFTRAPASAWVTAVLIGALLGLAPIHTPVALPGTADVFVGAAERLANAMTPGWAGVTACVAAIIGQEAVFRGWLLRVGGPVSAAVAYAVVCAPLDPVAGLVIAVPLTLLAARAESALPAVLAHATLALVAATSAGAVTAPVAWGAALLAASLAAAWYRLFTAAAPQPGR